MDLLALIVQVVKDIETRTEDPEEKGVISRILEFKESSLSKLRPFYTLNNVSGRFTIGLPVKF